MNAVIPNKGKTFEKSDKKTYELFAEEKKKCQETQQHQQKNIISVVHGREIESDLPHYKKKEVIRGQQIKRKFLKEINLLCSKNQI